MEQHLDPEEKAGPRLLLEEYRFFCRALVHGRRRAAAVNRIRVLFVVRPDAAARRRVHGSRARRDVPA